MLLDSNIIIYASRPDYHWLREFIARHSPAVSAVSFVETLGYHNFTEQERTFLEEFFSASEILPITSAVVHGATRLRQQRKMSLGDSIVAATALVFDLQFVTRNTADFRWIPGLRLVDPFDSPDLTG